MRGNATKKLNEAVEAFNDDFERVRYTMMRIGEIIALRYPEPQAEPQAEAQVQAEALLHEIQTYAEDVIGKYVPQSHLDRFYGELCERKGWEPKHWCVSGSELGKITDRVLKKRGTKRFMVYKIPRACAHSLRLADHRFRCASS